MRDRSCYASDMSKPKRPRDANQLAKAIVDLATGEADECQHDDQEASGTVERARKGGLKGGKARAKALTPEQRAEIARAAATARWKRSD